MTRIFIRLHTILVDIPLDICEITVSIEILLEFPEEDFTNLDAVSRIICEVDGAVPFKCPSAAAVERRFIALVPIE